MTNFRSGLLKLLLRFQFANWSSGTIAEQRARQERSVRFLKLPAQTKCTPVDVNGVPAEWIEAPGSGPGAVLYLHGGAYALGSVNIHRELIARLAHLTKTRALAINYRLAPEHPFPAALDDVLAAYHWLLQRFPPARIILAGDSAGGGLALAALVSLGGHPETLPAGAVCLSPWADLALAGESLSVNAHADLILDPRDLDRYASFYAGSTPTTHPLISPLYADLSGLPPLLIQVGADEILLDDARRVAQNARAAGTPVTLEVYPAMFHVFQMFSFIPETKKALDSIAAFIHAALDR
jgi:acetyl esterase/lipase